MNEAIAFAIKTLASLLLDSETFIRIQGVVNRWADKEIASAEKRDGVLAEFEVIGLKLAKWEANLGLELAVAYLKKVGK